MNTLYTCKRSVPNKYKIIDDIDTEFDKLVANNFIGINNTDMMIMKAIDNVVKYSKGLITTKFGNTLIFDLSTGCKACILANHSNDSTVINIEQCGKNALNVIFALDNKRYLMRFSGITRDVKIKNPIKINKTGNIYNSADKIYEAWGNKDGN